MYRILISWNDNNGNSGFDYTDWCINEYHILLQLSNLNYELAEEGHTANSFIFEEDSAKTTIYTYSEWIDKFKGFPEWKEINKM